jgi:hypothetical protein
MASINLAPTTQDAEVANAAAHQIEGNLSDALLKLAEDYEVIAHKGCYNDQSLQSLPGLKAQAQKLADVFKALETKSHAPDATKKLATAK